MSNHPLTPTLSRQRRGSTEIKPRHYPSVLLTFLTECDNDNIPVVKSKGKGK